MSEVKVSILEDGPYKLEGEITLTDADGTPVETRAGKAVFLCRCGGSTRKPFCDGTHSRIGFSGASEAVEASRSR